MNTKDPRNSEAHVIEYRVFCIGCPEFVTLSVLEYLYRELHGAIRSLLHAPDSTGCL